MSKKIHAFIMAILCVATMILSASCSPADNSSEDGSEVEFSVTSETASVDYSQFEGITINVYNWGEYISDGSEGSVNVNKEFTKLTGIKVNYTNYTSNEDMYAKIVSGGASYDIIIPSDYMIQRLATEGRLEKLDFSNIPNYKYIEDKYKNLYFDVNNEYSVPYNVGMVGVIYNKTMVEGTPDSWDLLWNEKYSGNILMFNNPRDAFAIAQFYEGLDINGTNEADWEKALNRLKSQKSHVKAYVMDEVFNKMESGAAAISPYYAGDFLSMYGNNQDLAFYYPKEGTNIFVDSICIPKGSPNKAAAELYINFLLDPNVALQNAEMICYASPNKGVTENEEYHMFLEELHPDAYNILYPDVEKLYPGVDLNNYYFRDFPAEMHTKINELWNQLKIETNEDSSTTTIYIICAVVLAVIVVFYIVSKIKKKRRENA